ncbi:MAG TPA: hypothetical protein VEZ48_05695 [Sphingomonadaceae bacterium]|nr:hypothetical protein [Sphingomonadaceae bacterium]
MPTRLLIVKRPLRRATQSPVKKAARVETRASHKPGAQAGLDL